MAANKINSKLTKSIFNNWQWIISSSSLLEIITTASIIRSCNLQAPLIITTKFNAHRSFQTPQAAIRSTHAHSSPISVNRVVYRRRRYERPSSANWAVVTLKMLQSLCISRMRQWQSSMGLPSQLLSGEVQHRHIFQTTPRISNSTRSFRFRNGARSCSASIIKK